MFYFMERALIPVFMLYGFFTYVVLQLSAWAGWNVDGLLPVMAPLIKAADYWALFLHLFDVRAEGWLAVSSITGFVLMMVGYVVGIKIAFILIRWMFALVSRRRTR